MRPRVLLVRGHAANPWELRPWEGLSEGFDVSFLQTGRGQFDTSALALERRPARTLRDALPRGRLGELLARLPGDRYLEPRVALAGAEVVHAHELGNWSAAQAAAVKQELGFKLVLTTWETIPFRSTFRNLRTRPYRRLALERTDRFFATTERIGGSASPGRGHAGCCGPRHGVRASGCADTDVARAGGAGRHSERDGAS